MWIQRIARRVGTGRFGVLACAAMLLPAAANASAELPPAAALPPATLAGSAWDVLLDGGEHRRFLELAARVDLHRVLDGDHAVTVFAPGDAAFDALGEAEMAELLTPEGRPGLRELIAGHVLWGEMPSDEVRGWLLRPTLPGFAVVLQIEAAADAGPDHAHTADCDHMADAAAGHFIVAGIEVVERDRRARNGVIHRVDALIRRPLGPAGPTGVLRHARACEENPSHAAQHPRRAEVARRRQAARDRREPVPEAPNNRPLPDERSPTLEEVTPTRPDGGPRPDGGRPGGGDEPPPSQPPPPTGCGCGGG